MGIYLVAEMSPKALARRHKFLCRWKAKLEPEQAQTYLLAAQKSGHYHDPETLEVYPCLACGALHIGHHSKNGAEPR